MVLELDVSPTEKLFVRCLSVGAQDLVARVATYVQLLTSDTPTTNRS